VTVVGPEAHDTPLLGLAHCDKPRSHRGWQASLSELGYHALEAADGAKGVDLLHLRRIDLLVTDIGLPGLPGLPGLNGRQVADAGRSLVPG
jgi:CheY-like chemotaxis protein